MNALLLTMSESGKVQSTCEYFHCAAGPLAQSVLPVGGKEVVLLHDASHQVAVTESFFKKIIRVLLWEKLHATLLSGRTQADPLAPANMAPCS